MTMTVDTSLDMATGFTILCGVVAGVRWIWEWERHSAWERSRFLLEEMEDFRHRESTLVIHQLLDWSASTVTLDDTTLVVRDEDLLAALDLHTDRQRFTADELLLRNTLDQYFDDLSVFLYMVEVGLINPHHLRRALDYWFRILQTGGSKGPEWALALHRYLQFYGWDALHQFIRDHPPLNNNHE